MNKREKIEQLYTEFKPAFIENLNDAIIGFDLNSKKVVYSYQKALGIIMSDGIDIDIARENIHNAVTTKLEDGYPIFIDELSVTN